jgi:hypothetical protein
LSDCGSNKPVSYKWTRVKDCVVDVSDSTDYIGSVRAQCESDTDSQYSTYYDTACSDRVYTYRTTFDECNVYLYNSVSNLNDQSYASYQYGICQSSSTNSNDDEITFSQSAYDGAIAGTFFCGIVLGLLLCGVIIYCCCLDKLIAMSAAK